MSLSAHSEKLESHLEACQECKGTEFCDLGRFLLLSALLNECDSAQLDALRNLAHAACSQENPNAHFGKMGSPAVRYYDTDHPYRTALLERIDRQAHNSPFRMHQHQFSRSARRAARYPYQLTPEPSPMFDEAMSLLEEVDLGVQDLLRLITDESEVEVSFTPEGEGKPS